MKWLYLTSFFLAAVMVAGTGFLMRDEPQEDQGLILPNQRLRTTTGQRPTEKKLQQQERSLAKRDCKLKVPAGAPHGEFDRCMDNPAKYEPPKPRRKPDKNQRATER